MAPLVWIGIGIGVGLLAPLLAGDGLGLFGDLLFGVLGAFLGGWVIDSILVSGALAGTAVAALIGAAAFVTALRLSHHRSALST